MLFDRLNRDFLDEDLKSLPAKYAAMVHMRTDYRSVAYYFASNNFGSEEVHHGPSMLEVITMLFIKLEIYGMQNTFKK